MLDEVLVWKFLKHPNVVPLLGMSKTSPPYMVSQWMPHGTITAFLQYRPAESRLKYVCHHNSVTHFVGEHMSAADPRYC